MPSIRSLLKHLLATASTPFVILPMPCFAEVTVLAFAGAPAPDGDGSFDLFSLPVLGDSGTAAFYSQLDNTSAGATNNLALLTGDGEDLAVVARNGSTQIKGEDVVAFYTPSLLIDGSDRVLGHASVDGQSLIYFTGDSAGVDAVVDPAAPSPSGDNQLLFTSGNALMGPSGAVVYRATYSGNNAETGLYLRSPDGQTSTVVLVGDPAPGGGAITAVSAAFTMNASDQVAFTASAEDAQEYQALLRYANGTGVELARLGDNVSESIATIVNISSLSSINSNGSVAFAGDYTEPGAEREGVFLATDDGLAMLAGGVLPGGNFAARDIVMTGLNDSNQTAFLADVATGGRAGIYLADEQGVSLVAMEDSLTPNGDSYFAPFFNSGVSINDRGEVVFGARLSDAPVTAVTGYGVFAYTRATGLQQLFAIGDPLLGSEITGLGFAGQGEFLSQSNLLGKSGLNNGGQVAFLFGLADGREGIAVWTPDTDLAGDFNADGVVNAADYTVWRDGFGDAYDADDYVDWRANYGATGAADIAAAVPAPGTLGLIALACLGIASRAIRTTRHRTGRRWVRMGDDQRLL